MEPMKGTALYPGVAMGNIHVLPDQEKQESKNSKEEPAEELERLERALGKARKETDRQYHIAKETLGQEQADIFRLHGMMLEDQDFLEIARAAVREDRFSAQEGVEAARAQFSSAFHEINDPYLQARAADVDEVARLWQDCLKEQQTQMPALQEPAILAARELTPGQLISMGRDKVLGLVVEHMCADSHAAILVRAMNLPTVIGVVPQESWQGVFAALDGASGTLYLEPDQTVLGVLGERRKAEQTQKERLSRWRDIPSRTIDGKKVAVCANIGSAEEAVLALQEGAEGVGLFRTEFLCLDKAHCPGEEEQFEVYCRALQAMKGRRVVIRTWDIGGDKCPPWLEEGRAENPALGLRGIRLSLKRPGFFIPQLRAVLRAAVYGQASLMFPMVTALHEVCCAKALLEQCRAELEQEGIQTGEVEVGVMIETPAAALIAGELAREVDFFSIGTNDLTQYTLAMDRQDPALAECRNPYHPAVLELIGHTVAEGHRHGCRVALCGQLGADPNMTETLLRMGVDELSVPLGEILNLKARVASLDLSK